MRWLPPCRIPCLRFPLAFCEPQQEFRSPCCARQRPGHGRPQPPLADPRSQVSSTFPFFLFRRVAQDKAGLFHPSWTRWPTGSFVRTPGLSRGRQAAFARSATGSLFYVTDVEGPAGRGHSCRAASSHYDSARTVRRQSIPAKAQAARQIHTGPPGRMGERGMRRRLLAPRSTLLQPHDIPVSPARGRTNGWIVAH